MDNSNVEKRGEIKKTVVTAKQKVNSDSEKSSESAATIVVEKEEKSEQFRTKLKSLEEKFKAAEQQLGRKEKELAGKGEEVEQLQKLRETEKGFQTGARVMARGIKLAEKGAIKFWEIAKSKAKIPLLHRKIDTLLTQLGCEVYDLESQGVIGIMESENVKSIIKQLKKFNKEIKVIQERVGK